MNKTFTLKLAVAAITLAAFSSHAGAFDFGKLIEDQLQQKQDERAAKEAAKNPPAEGAAAPTDAAPPPKQKFDAAKLGFALFGDYSTEEETRIGRQLAGNLLGAAPLVKDDALQRYVNLVGNWVALNSGRNDIAWRFGVIDSEDINAFAAPGGFIFVTKGLYRQLNNEAELAGVLGHEIAHVTQKHHLKVLKKSTLIGELGKAVGNKTRNSDEAVQNLIGNGAEMLARGLDKDAEFEADRVGLVFAARAGYDPWGLPNVLQSLAALPAKDARTSFLYKTHPHPADRLDRLGAAVGDRLDGIQGRDAASRFYRLK
jgi:predicted Zn-dependent protease